MGEIQVNIFLSIFLCLILLSMPAFTADSEKNFLINKTTEQTQDVQNSEKCEINQSEKSCKKIEQGRFLLPSREQSSGLERILKTIEGTAQIY